MKNDNVCSSNPPLTPPLAPAQPNNHNNQFIPYAYTFQTQTHTHTCRANLNLIQTHYVDDTFNGGVCVRIHRSLCTLIACAVRLLLRKITSMNIIHACVPSCVLACLACVLACESVARGTARRCTKQYD